MNIHSGTKIAEIIRANPDAIQAIASLSKPLEKLKNPLLRRVMASRVNLAQAAVMGSCTVADLAAVLKPLGFHFVDDDVSSQGDPLGEKGRPNWLIQATNIDTFDARPVIQSGSDPLQTILKHYQALTDGSVLCIVNTFIPYPLIDLLEGKGADTYIETDEPQLHRSYFYKLTSATSSTKDNMADPAQTTFYNEVSFGRILEQCDGLLWKEIDVRALEMPEPMHTILGELQDLPKGKALHIQHKRVPVFLLEALENQPFNIHIYEVSEGDTRILIIRE